MRSALLAAWLGAITAAGPAVAANPGKKPLSTAVCSHT